MDEWRVLLLGLGWMGGECCCGAGLEQEAAPGGRAGCGHGPRLTSADTGRPRTRVVSLRASRSHCDLKAEVGPR